MKMSYEVHEEEKMQESDTVLQGSEEEILQESSSGEMETTQRGAEEWILILKRIAIPMRVMTIAGRVYMIYIALKI